MYYRNQTIDIPNTLSLLTQCWNAAEAELQECIFKFSPKLNEENITSRFHCKLAKQFTQANEKRHFESAFLQDLYSAFPDIETSYTFNQISSGLMATVTLHNIETEKYTGGDFGITITRPQLDLNELTLNIGKYKTGLLCQAKLKNSKNRWNKLTENQMKVLNNNLNFSALVLYSYNDPDRRKLSKFQWQQCKEASSTCEVNNWLSTSYFPNPQFSNSSIRDLGYGRIGTDDSAIIKSKISPDGGVCLEIRIDWPDDSCPDQKIYLDFPEDNKTTRFVNTSVN